jgi:hypothetical protein
MRRKCRCARVFRPPTDSMPTGLRRGGRGVGRGARLRRRRIRRLGRCHPLAGEHRRPDAKGYGQPTDSSDKRPRTHTIYIPWRPSAQGQLGRIDGFSPRTRGSR